MSPALAMADNPVLLDPMRALNAGERTTLRKLYREGPALSLGFGRGWMLGGTRYSARALQRFIDLGVARFWRDDDGVKIALNYTGRLAAERIMPSGPVLSTSQDD